MQIGATYEMLRNYLVLVLPTSALLFWGKRPRAREVLILVMVGTKFSSDVRCVVSSPTAGR
eukprot:scaffold23810_cov130-Amphora_coffeaeformis.AAC.1